MLAGHVEIFDNFDTLAISTLLTFLKMLRNKTYMELSDGVDVLRLLILNLLNGLHEGFRLRCDVLCVHEDPDTVNGRF